MALSRRRSLMACEPSEETRKKDCQCSNHDEYEGDGDSIGLDNCDSHSEWLVMRMDGEFGSGKEWMAVRMMGWNGGCRCKEARMME